MMGLGGCGGGDILGYDEMRVIHNLCVFEGG